MASCFVDLATISDPTLFGAALVTALGIRGNPDNSLAAVLDYLRPRQMLIILDNCEHVLPAATIFAGRFMADTSPSKLLATSREPLGTATEHVVRLGSLPSPRSGRRPDSRSGRQISSGAAVRPPRGRMVGLPVRR